MLSAWATGWWLRSAVCYAASSHGLYILGGCVHTSSPTAGKKSIYYTFLLKCTRYVQHWNWLKQLFFKSVWMYRLHCTVHNRLQDLGLWILDLNCCRAQHQLVWKCQKDSSQYNTILWSSHGYPCHKNLTDICSWRNENDSKTNEFSSGTRIYLIYFHFYELQINYIKRCDSEI